MELLKALLDQHGLSQYSSSLISNGFEDLESLVLAKDEDLKELGWLVGHRRRLFGCQG